MASSKHKTHVSSQAAFHRHDLTRPGGGQLQPSAEKGWLDYERVCRFFPDESRRAEALGITLANVADWAQRRNGRSLRRWMRTFARIRRACELLEPSFERPEEVAEALLAIQPTLEGKSSLAAIVDGSATPEVAVALLLPAEG